MSREYVVYSGMVFFSQYFSKFRQTFFSCGDWGDASPSAPRKRWPEASFLKKNMEKWWKMNGQTGPCLAYANMSYKSLRCKGSVKKQLISSNFLRISRKNPQINWIIFIEFCSEFFKISRNFAQVSIFVSPFSNGSSSQFYWKCWTLDHHSWNFWIFHDFSIFDEF